VIAKSGQNFMTMKRSKKMGIIEMSMLIVVIAMLGILKNERDCYKRGGKGLRRQYRERFTK